MEHLAAHTSEDPARTLHADVTDHDQIGVETFSLFNQGIGGFGVEHRHGELRLFGKLSQRLTNGGLGPLEVVDDELVAARSDDLDAWVVEGGDDMKGCTKLYRQIGGGSESQLRSFGLGEANDYLLHVISFSG